MGSYAFELRVLCCAQCGAPVQAALSGGSVTCSYCQTVNHVVTRDDSAARATAGAPATMSEAQRIESLRQQDGKDRPVPPSLAHLLRDGTLHQDDVPTAMNEWRRAHGDYLAGAGFSAAERLYTLTLLLREHMRASEASSRLRAMIESTLGALNDPHHMQVLHSILAQEAALEGDLDAASKWLALTSPHSTDLHGDSSHRVAKALIATRRGDFLAVTRALGPAKIDVPIADEEDTLCVLLRANAFERQNKMEQATEAILPLLMGHDGGKELQRVLGANHSLHLCSQSLQAARLQAKHLLDNAVANLGVIILVLLSMVLSAATTAGVIFLVRQLGLVRVGGSVEIVAGIVTGLGMLFGPIVYSRARADVVKKHGIRGRALVLRVTVTSQQKDGTQHIQLLLFVKLPNRAPYAAKYHQVGLRKSERVGHWVPIMVHPTNPRRMVLL